MQLLIVVEIVVSLLVASSAARAETSSRCYGSTSNGRLEHGVRLPSSGKNFTSYSGLAELVGRTFVHSSVRDVMLSAYKALEDSQPGHVFKYAETGYREGGPFKPHKTHQNGLSVDHMVPVKERGTRSPGLFYTGVFNRLGYDYEFDRSGASESYLIDFDALGDLIMAMYESAKVHRVGIWRVIFAPDLQARLYASKRGSDIRKFVMIPKKPSWVRHDEHIHIDFRVDCDSMN